MPFDPAPLKGGTGAVRVYRKQPHEVGELRRMCALWSQGQGAERFWSFEEMVDALARNDVRAWYLTEDGESDVWLGAAFASVAGDASDLLYIYIDPAVRRQGAGRRLMSTVMADLHAAGVQVLFLEVRAGNVVAQAMYVSLGMEPVGKRVRYYRDGEDALVFRGRLAGAMAAGTPEGGKP